MNSVSLMAPTGPATEVDLTLHHGPVEAVRADELKPGDLVSAHGYADSLDWLTVAQPDPCHACGSTCIALSYVDDDVARAYLAVVPDLDADHYTPSDLLVARRLLGGVL